MVLFYFARCVLKHALYSDVIHLFDWKSAVEHNRMVVFKKRDSVPRRDIPAFVMYCVNGESASLLIESTDSMINVNLFP